MTTTDHLRSLYGSEPTIRLSTADCCVECQRLISSERQKQVQGTDVCALCAEKYNNQ